MTDDNADGAGAFANDEEFSVYELSHPLNSGEAGKDFALTPPTTIGMLLQLQVGNGEVTVTTRYPVGMFPTYVVITQSIGSMSTRRRLRTWLTGQLGGLCKTMQPGSDSRPSWFSSWIGLFAA